MHLDNNYQRTLKNEGLLLTSLGTGHARGPHSEVVFRGESTELASRMVEPKVSWVHSLLNLKHKRNLSLRREKKGHSVSLLPRLPQVL